MRKKTILKLNVILAILLCFSQVFINATKEKKVYASSYSIYGNDISHWQKDIDFSKMKKVSNFVIIRIGYSTKLDGRFLEYMTNAKKAGIPIGIYVYSLANTPKEAENEAHWVANTLSLHNFDKGYLDYPIFFDYEEASFITSNTKSYNTQIINAFVNTISSYGYYAGLYMGGYYFENHVVQEDISCDVWLAHYFNNMRDISKFKALHPSSKITMWQFGADGYNTLNTGKVCGVSTTVIDENYCFVDYPSIIQRGGFNGYEVITPDLPQEKPPVIENPSSSESATPPQSSINSSNTPSSDQNSSSNEDLPVFKPQSPTSSSSGGCNSSIYSVFGIVLVPLAIFSIAKLMKKEP